MVGWPWENAPSPDSKKIVDPCVKASQCERDARENFRIIKEKSLGDLDDFALVGKKNGEHGSSGASMSAAADSN